MHDEAGLTLAGAVLERTLSDLRDPKHWPDAWTFAWSVGCELIELLGGDVDLWLLLVRERGEAMEPMNEGLDKLLDGLRRGLGQCVKAIEVYQEEQRKEVAKQEKESRKTEVFA